jgi:hypothetical protein
VQLESVSNAFKTLATDFAFGLVPFAFGLALFRSTSGSTPKWRRRSFEREVERPPLSRRFVIVRLH